LSRAGKLYGLTVANASGFDRPRMDPRHWGQEVCLARRRGRRPRPFASFQGFWPYSFGEHCSATNRTLHTVGTRAAVEQWMGDHQVSRKQQRERGAGSDAECPFTCDGATGMIRASSVNVRGRARLRVTLLLQATIRRPPPPPDSGRPTRRPSAARDTWSSSSWCEASAATW
jgi:hypothetical protein